MTQDSQTSQSPSGQKIIINQVEKPTNGIGTAGFVLSIITIFIGWIPFIGWIIWLLGLIFSFVGVFNKPKGLAIAGLVISLIGVFILLAIFGVLLGSAAFL